ncbi:MAG: YbaB/EbfC family nucleoid-associated protein [Candidatus Eisenbacteria bacterium]|uniref:Nucleoid-associated protein KJ970_01920 n=1 Tax=Eiseniibacteriota bacterium TaxID=2212470 RepID=A0A948RRI1_UNCEI|nr:YbaB/EbfC family nucleoid-associated protein [Candidatus Eisenbacteria bacterium]MBU1951031.1 YbaB/EbfC family nucleoid-associated protein [Candidatus Eisenbacteria bacterium]MBU2689660.1 YbaB/EbfC family nucleoid-associated protein [Candidatus Eisenbacteria bacterium]
MDIGKLMKQAQKMQAQLSELKEELAERRITATAGGGMVTVEANGRHEILSLKIDPQVVDPQDVEMLEDLIVAAVNEAQRQSEEMFKEEMSKLTGGLPMPGLFG